MGNFFKVTCGNRERGLCHKIQSPKEPYNSEVKLSNVGITFSEFKPHPWFSLSSIVDVTRPNIRCDQTLVSLTTKLDVHRFYFKRLYAI